ncbi:hypothetical protein [Streptomyces noursei]
MTLLAVRERPHNNTDPTARDIWHLINPTHTCNADCDAHPIACTDENIHAPGTPRAVPNDLSCPTTDHDDPTAPRPHWCPPCLHTAYATNRTTHQAAR